MDYPKSVPGVGLVAGRFVNEDPIAGRAGSLIPAEWGCSVTDSILAVQSAAGLAPDEEDPNQLAEAILWLLRNTAATEAARGTLKISSVEQAQALIDDATAMTPKKLADAFRAGQVLSSSAINQPFPSGLILKAGVFSQAAGTVTFPTPFPNLCLGAFGSEAAVIPGNMGFIVFQYTALTRFSFQPQLRDADRLFPNAANIRYLALGY